MIRISEIKQSLDAGKEDLFEACRKILKIKNEQIISLTISRRSVDSRNKDNVFFSFPYELSHRDCEVLHSTYIHSQAYICLYHWVQNLNQ